MVTKVKLQIALWSAVSFVLIAFSNTAAAIPCGAGGVSGSTMCQDGSANNDFLNPLEVNAESFFGFTDWEVLQKQNTPGLLETWIDVGWTVSPLGGTQTGTWEFNPSVWTEYEDVMIVLKSGNIGGTFFSGYLLDNVAMPNMGTWDTGSKDISHLTLYARGDVPPGGGTVPEPTTLGLLGIGLLAARFGRRRSAG